jgi:pimeloyl-ACP methyl ester carboxylesterase
MCPYPIYLLPGLGTDQRIFSWLQLEAAEIQYLPFPEPERGESTASYATRMAQGITHSGPVVLVGFSLGGILAQEIALQRPVQRMVLISTVQSRAELPIGIRAARLLPLHRIPVRPETRVKTVRFWGRLFGVKHVSAVMMFSDMLLQYTDWYFRWASDAVVNWQGAPSSVPRLHLHGTNDLIFPSRYLRQAELIPGGTHAMIVSHAEMLSARINHYLSEEADNTL